MIKDTTVDFIILKKEGYYLCKSKMPNEFRKNHLNATSFNTRKDAEAATLILRLGNAKVIKRMSVLED